MNYKRRIRDSIIVVSLSGVLLVASMSDIPETKETIITSENENTVYQATAGASNIYTNVMNGIRLASITDNPITIVGLGLEEETSQPEDTLPVEETVVENIPSIVAADENSESEAPIVTEIVEYEAYVSSASSINVRTTPDAESEDNKIDTVYGGETLNVTGVVVSTEEEWARIEYETEDGETETAYVANEYITEKLDESETYNTEWTGKTLNKHDGSVTGPSGKETYYNLNMSRCVSYVNNLGYYGDVWVRNDGTKMLGNYVMVAANLKVHPKGSLVETSLGTGIVVDTGEFAQSNPYQLDIATTWGK